MKGLKWFWHVERRSGKRFTERVYKSDVGDGRDRGRLSTRLLNGVGMACSVKSLKLTDAMVKYMDK